LPIRNQTKAATGEHGSEQKILFKRQKIEVPQSPIELENRMKSGYSVWGSTVDSPSGVKGESRRAVAEIWAHFYHTIT